MPHTTKTTPGQDKDTSDPYRDRRKVSLPDGQIVLIRSVEPVDEAPLQTFFSQISPNDLRLRFFSNISPRDPSLSADLTQIRKKGMVALLAFNEQTQEIWGVGQLNPDSKERSAEFAILIRSDMKGRGIGWVLLNQLLERARNAGIYLVTGQVLLENSTMLKMCRELGFTIEPWDAASHTVTVRIRTKAFEEG